MPRNLNMQGCQQTVESSQELLEVYNANPEDFDTRLVTGDETWLHHWDPDNIKENFAPNRFHTQPSAGKVMATVFSQLLRNYIDRIQVCRYFTYLIILCQWH